MSISHPSKKLFRNPWPLLCVVLLAAQHLSAQSPGPGFALHFDGIGCYGGVCGDFVDIPNYGNLVPTNEITIEFWQRASLVQEQSTFDLKPGEADHAIAAYAPRGDGKVYWDFGDPSSQGELAYTPPVSIVGSWQHFALVASQSGNFMAIYRNGTLEAWKSGMTPFVRDNFDLMLGDYFYIGDIDEFRIWNVARTSGQIQSNYSRSLAGNEPGLVAYWRFDEGMGTILTDSSGSGLNGNLIGNSVVPYPVWVLSGAPITNPPLGSPVITTLPADNVLTHGGRLNGTVNPVGQDTTAWFHYGTTTYYESATAPIAISGTNAAFVPVNSAILNLFSGTPYHYRLVAANSAGTNAGLDSTFTTLGTPPGSPGNAIHFNGASGFAGVVAADGFGAAMPTNEITIEFWQNSTASLLQFPISLNPDSSTNHILIATPGFNNLVTWDFGNSNAQGHLEYTPPDSLVNTWQHFACVASQSGNYMAIYRNGILEARKTNMSPFIRGNYSLLMGEFFPGPWCFNGTIDEVRVWNAARTSAQIQTNMNRSLVGNEPDLVGYWRFNEGAGTTTADGSGHGFTAGLAPGPEGAPNWSSSTAPIYTTPVGIPIAVTQTPTSFTTNGATLNGNVVPEGGNAAAWFQYGATTNYGSVTPTTLIVGTNVVAVAVSNLVTSLSAGILYHCQIIATNSAGTNRGADQVFAILGLPIATTLSAAPVTSTNATLNGIVYSDGYPTTVWFQYGTTTNYGSLTSFTIAPPTNTVSFAVGNLTGGLSQGVTYHYQFVASNVVGVAYGLDIPFTPLNTNTLLSGLTFSGRPLNPMFDPAITNYIVGLNSISNATVTATLQDSNASLQLQVNGGSFSPLLSASPSAPLTFLVGFNPVNVRVTAENGMDTQTYTLNVAEFGANFLVTTTNATGPGSLSYAINVANPNPGPHVITLASNAVYACTITDNFWYGPNAFPPIASDITIEGNGATIVRATTNRLRFFYVGADPNNPATAFYNSPGAGKLTLHNLTLTNGLALGGNGGGGGAGMGGAIFSQGILVLDSVTLSGNTAQGGKGQASQTYPYSPDAAGGGMGQDGGLVFYGGGFGGKVTPAGSHGAPTNGVDGGGGGGFAIFDNANSGYGGGAANGLGGNTPNAMGGNGSGAGSSAYPNYTPGFGSHPYAAPGAPGGNFGFGGGYGGRYSENAETAGTAGSGGGVGSGGGGGIHGDVAVGQPGGGGFGGGGGAGHYGASGGFGGGAGGDTTGDNDGSVVSGGYGGGQAGLNASGCGGGAGMGGAVFNHNGSVSLINCTLALNSAGGGSASFGFAYLNSGVGAQGGSGFGGAIFNLNGSVTIQNTTLASNSVAAGISPKSNNQGTNGPPGLAAGGALYSMVYESATSRSGAVTLVNSILAGSVGGSDVVNIFPATTSVGMNLGSVLLTAREPSILQTFTNSGGIFISNGVLAADPLLGPLANNGGPTPTMLPLPGSPAIDAGDSKFAAATDQRGQPRIAGAAVDLGAVELPGAPFFTGVSFTNATQIQLQFRAVAGMAYSVLTTTDLSLTNWTVLGSATEISPGQFQFTDHLATNSPTRYYRVHHP